MKYYIVCTEAEGIELYWTGGRDGYWTKSYADAYCYKSRSSVREVLQREHPSTITIMWIEEMTAELHLPIMQRRG
ncbi:MAG: hypothetical protein CLLPBCKN_000438 [Chroococcidiopsis cubana SAG 39.79]|uniref:Uncharacterized protein n=1 Tax=Chroococcidiopsis cubana SAG 39.79 TaxID=388085 RepID=A0AB37UB84_9CYAN|nr:hypothetical protein [Chroococcidiopsis cubana]MDZ4871050.1 hypothetical protein [Chroococcidiopsis cubana SAG 39.79]PSB65581.1 hypothetical protein C7B79_04785 [Chroococcidiopsis cubana CCALA 043]RUT02339.1 hypothetical protein DSM107010_62790 [Chroococcidiopsis cubana SAG 39.79]